MDRNQLKDISGISSAVTVKENETLDDIYASWVMNHPSALNVFDEIIASANGKKIAVFLDYDGTLSPIVEDPNCAFMSDMMRSTVDSVAKCFPTAIISGRARYKVQNFVDLPNVCYAGSHGMDIMAPRCSSSSTVNCQTGPLDELEKEFVHFEPAKEFLPALKEIMTTLEAKTKDIHGVYIENNIYCISIHFRRVHKEDFHTLEKHVTSIQKDYPRFHMTRGRKVMEIRPSIKWDKGCALLYLLESMGLGNESGVLPFYIGDDRTDEDAFKVLKAKKQGFPIIVSSIPKETNAIYSLRGPPEVMCFLMQLARWGKLSSYETVS